MKQLTDGEIFKPGDSGALWTWKGTVGWHAVGYVMVVIDLKTRCQIEKIEYHTAGGGHADVYFPGKSEFFVSENGVDYTPVRTVTPADDGFNEEPRSSILHTFTADNVNRTGRYVMLGLRFGDKSGYLFTDEVYVYGNPVVEQTEVSPPKDAAVEIANFYLTRIAGAVDNGAPSARLIVDRRTHMLSNLRRVEKAVDNPSMTPAQETAYRVLKAQIEILKKSISSNPDENEWRVFITTTLGLYSRAMALPLAGRGYVVWDKNIWDPLMPSDMPSANTPELKTLNVRAVGNEYESACITFSNVSDIPLELRVEPPMLFEASSGVTRPPVGVNIDRIIGPPVPQIAVGPGGWITLRQASFAETGAGMQGDALPELDEASMFIVPPTSTGQLWLTISTRNVPPGRYSALLRMKPVQTAVFKESQIEINLEVLNTRLEGAPPIRTIGWAYPRFTEIVGHGQTAVQDQLNHYMDTFDVEIWLCSPFGVYGVDGSVITPANFEKLDRYLDLYKGGRMFLIYTSGVPGMSVKGQDGVKDVLSASKEWDAAFKSWYKEVVNHLISRGLTYDEFAFYPIDEPWTPESGEEYLKVVKLAKEVDAKAKTFVTAPGVPLERLQTWAPYTDILCLGGPDEDAKAKALIAEGKEVWYYGGGANKAHHPLGVARMNFWNAFHLGLKGQGVWDYCCSGWQKTGEETAWTELDTGGRADASLIYRGKYGPVTSKRWEAWRDGVEDYWLLTILQKLYREGKTDIDPSMLAESVVVRPVEKEKVEIPPLEMALYADTNPVNNGQVIAGRKALLDAISKIK